MRFYAENIAQNPGVPFYDLSDDPHQQNYISLHDMVRMAGEEVDGVPHRHPFGAKALEMWVEILKARGELATE